MATRSSNPRPKRNADTWTRTHHQEAGSSSPKKARFDLRNPSALAPDAPDDEEDDAFLDADELTKRGTQTKRNAVNIDGFESDSSNEGFDARATAKAKAKRDAENAAKSRDEDENDMFADLEEPDGDADEDLEREGKKSKAVKFADLDEVEDLEEIDQSTSGGHVSADIRGEAKEEDEASSSSDSEVSDERRAALEDGMDEELGAGAKKKHAPKLDAFNLRAENQEGRFDESLNFVRKATDPDAIFDSWMEGTSKKDMRKAKEAQAKRDEDQRRKSRTDDALDTGELLHSLINSLQKGENSLEALARLAPKKSTKKKIPKWQAKKQKAKSNEMDIEDADSASAPTADDETLRRKAVEAITEATDVLMERGVIDINDSREKLTRLYTRETGEEWHDASEDDAANGNGNGHAAATEDTWEFRWSSKPDQIQGPRSRADMKAWSDAGYFADGVEFRRAGSDGLWKTNVAF